MSIGMLTLSFFLCLFMHRYLLRENARKDTEMMAQGLTLESYFEEQEFQEREKGDDASVSIVVFTYDGSLNYA